MTARAGAPGSADERRYAPGETRQTEQQLRTLVEGVPHLIWRSCDRGLWTWASPQWLAFTGQTQEESHGHGWLDVVCSEDRARTVAAWQSATEAGELDVEFRVFRALDGAWVWHRTTSLPARDEAGRIIEWLGSTTDIQAYKDLQAKQQQWLADAERHAVALNAEIERRRQAEKRLQHLAFHDDLTGLHNRRWLLERLAKVLDSAPTASPACVLLCLDLDRFSAVNDSFGHRVGDRLLIEIARRLRQCLGDHGKLARLGGDEFGVMLEVDSVGAGLHWAARITATLREPVWLETHEVFTTCSIGVAKARPGATTADFVRDADMAMYAAKRQGPGRVAAFSPAMRDGAAAALRLETDLRHALDRGEIFVHYQPICEAGTRRVVGAEALARWHHPVHGDISPEVFIPAAERAGLIRKFGAAILRTACLEARSWQERPAFILSVNASGEELCDPRFPRHVQEILAATGYDASRLQIEVTEGVFLSRPELAADVISGLRTLGVQVALDDFGMGYSSLGYLSRYPVDALKIDRTFVAAMLHDPKSGAVVAAIQRLGQALDLRVVAEGVEDEGQLRMLKEMPCLLVQGFLLGRPMPAPELAAVLRSS